MNVGYPRHLGGAVSNAVAAHAHGVLLCAAHLHARDPHNWGPLHAEYWARVRGGDTEEQKEEGGNEEQDGQEEGEEEAPAQEEKEAQEEEKKIPADDGDDGAQES